MNLPLFPCLLLVVLCACSAPDAPKMTDGSTLRTSTPGKNTAKPKHATAMPTSDRIVSALQALKPGELQTSSPAVAHLLHTYFKDACQADDRLAFDTVCQSYTPEASVDPSPWPDVMLGLRHDRIVSIVTVARNATLNGWTCEETVVGGVQACYPPNTPAVDRVRWTQQWSAFMDAAN